MDSIFNPKVSIIIPVYNGSNFLAEAIDSALAQTYQNIEVVVINDGSNDSGETERIAVSYGDRIHYFSKPNGGVATALNMAIENMTGEYFSWLSHDDLYVNNKIEYQINMLSSIAPDELNTTIIYSDFIVFGDNIANDYPVILGDIPSERFRYWLTVVSGLHGCTLLIPKTAFEKIGTFNENLRTTQDYDLWFRMAKEFKFVHIPKLLIRARNHADQGTYKMTDTVSRECNELYSDFIRNLQAQEILLASGKSLAEGYMEIASSLFNRGYDEAGRLADKLSLENHPNGYIIMLTKRKLAYLKNKIIFTTKRLLPVEIKNMIKKIRSANRRKYN